MKAHMQIYVGCSGWFYWYWRGIFYPQTDRTDEWFKHYVSVFATVELNAPFYKWPKIATVKGSRRNAPPEFRYSVKVNQLITHERRLKRTNRLIKDFYSIAENAGIAHGLLPFSISPELQIQTVAFEKSHSPD
jgi:uncharacterized protein YecE (DUF72 family)